MDHELRHFIDPWPIHVLAGDWPIWNKQGELQPEVSDWLNDNVRGEWDYHEIYAVICFNLDVDEVLFRMRWR